MLYFFSYSRALNSGQPIVGVQYLREEMEGLISQEGNGQEGGVDARGSPPTTFSPATPLSSLLTSKRPTLPPVSLVLLGSSPILGLRKHHFGLQIAETFVLTRQLIWTEIYIGHSMRVIRFIPGQQDVQVVVM